MSAGAAVTADFYPASSRMAEGKWVKVEVAQSGVYSISYDELRAMGFANPETVGVFGNGGRQLPDNFTTSSGTPVIPADIEPVSVVHTGGSLLFYGLGPESIVPEVNAGSAFPHKYHYARESRNCYVNKGCYLLSDSGKAEMPVVSAPEPVVGALIDYGLDYWYHENDLEWNPTGTGRVFLGEDLRPSAGSSFEFPYDLPLASTGRKVRFVATTASHPSYAPRISYSLTGNATKNTTVNTTENLLTCHTYTQENFQLQQTSGTVTVTPNPTSSSTGFFNLDHILVTYQKQLPAAATPTQERYMFPQLGVGDTGTFSLPTSKSRIVFDITDRTHPKVLAPYGSDTSADSYALTATSLPAEVIIVDTAGEMLSVGNPEDVANSNLHAQACAGADLIIITTAPMRPYAEKIAALHKEHDGISSIVAEVQDIYNEFSGGTPDAMAYRSFARMVSERGAVKPKNILLFGPLLADSRGMYAPHPYDSFIIAWQDPTSDITLNSGAYNSNEWLGNFEDYSESKTYMRKHTLGVGVLPCLSDNDASLIVDKIERFMLDDSFASRANGYVACGGIGDGQMHASFALAVAGHYSRRTGKATVTHPVIADSYADIRQAASRFREVMSNEPLMACFFGHGNPYAFGNILETTDVSMLKNRNLGFMIFAGCTLGRSDRGFKGIGEHMVLSTRYGLVGGLIPSRNSSAYANRDLICAVNEAIYCTNPCCPSSEPLVRRDEPLTIGETIALAKSACTSSAVEGAYQLVCDPALRIPFPTLDVNMTSEQISTGGGETVAVSGVISTADGTFRDTFNGEVILRLMAPEYHCLTINKQSKESQHTDVTYGDRTLQMAAARVKDGRFTASLTIPKSLLDHVSDADSTMLYMTAFDPETRLSAAGYAVVRLDRTVAGETSAYDDVTAPVIERLAYNPVTNELELTVSDDVALDMSEGSMSGALGVTVDRVNQPQAANGARIIDPDSPRYSKNITLGSLSETSHTAEVKVRDAAGNITTSQLVFTPGDNLRPSLTADATAIASAVNLNVESAGAVDCILLVTDAGGRQAARLEIGNSSFRWDGADENGKRLLPGVYTLSAVDRAGRHSVPLRLAVL